MKPVSMSFETGFIAFLSDALHLPHAAKGTDERFGTAKGLSTSSSTSYYFY